MHGNWFPRRAPAVPAQALYATLVKETLSPALRAAGFKGSAGKYSLPSSDCWALLGFQKASGSTAAEVRFTINLQVVNKSAWTAARHERPHLPERPAASICYGKPTSWVRIGNLTPERADKWWCLSARTDLAELGKDVVHDITEYALPWFRHQLDR
ncbi:hypothetical protein GCM10029976_024830 [Kribbella albertanoniae]|uniref:DUF4304 domain-containing protein n=1 Tax=Kribbella albertanoniae TaxID=1266829 RepID=A0A4R4PIZ1_9ACTN|nr:DUF4304 domain-containing protein [Kribbella albertanoniae]TDC21869.1 DUF4304 domain-containing protein [Kribbella albertanoniae]